MPRPLVLVHGYSANDQAFHPVREALLATAKEQKIDLIEINVCNYISLNNEITIKDIAEGFDRALSVRAGLSKSQCDGSSYSSSYREMVRIRFSMSFMILH